MRDEVAGIADGPVTGPMNKAFNMKERKEPKFIQFAVGEVVEGILVQIDKVEVGERKQPTPRLIVKDLESGELYSFLATYDIAVKVRSNDIGHVISVRYEGEDTNVRREGRAMKRFKVMVSEKPYADARGNKLEDGTYITNADIPF